ncbi:MAG: FAD-dependent oxidoreductase, partial [Ruthenibacterium sp.]
MDYRGEAWIQQAPEVNENQIKENLQCDVLVIGGGLAGIAAVRAAAESGVQVILLEKCETPQARSGDFAVMDSQVADVWHRRNVDKIAIVTDLMKDMCYKVSQPILKRWAQEAGEAFDWYLEAYPDITVLPDTQTVPPTGCRCWIQPRRMPCPESFENATERFKCYQTTAWVRPTHIPVFEANFQRALKTGHVIARFGTSAKKLLREENGRVTGAIAQNTEGTWLRVTARRGVVLATGDYMSDRAMLERFCPGMTDTPQLWTSYDKQHHPSNTGDGHRMGMWIGAKLQDAPHAPCAHHMGSVFGASGFVLLNTQGERFVNEDAPGQQIGSQIENLPDKKAWQFVDGNWKNQVPNVYPNHGSVCCFVSDEKRCKLSTIDNYISPKLIENAVQNGK